MVHAQQGVELQQPLCGNAFAMHLGDRGLTAAFARGREDTRFYFGYGFFF